ncbi:MAG: hypothetical protein M2R45_04216 [Verrucomicrobia subdivision 3 bacterium]|nr:hypothetical protein [Limisphaerales bacterium]MCS1417047.1 hypothetical protein [Limisphaerales bacterium]
MPWVIFRPEIKVCDGDLISRQLFENKFVKAVYDTCIESGRTIIEMGYKGSKRLFARDKFGD